MNIVKHDIFLKCASIGSRSPSAVYHIAYICRHFTESDASLEEMRTKVKIMEDALKSNAMQYNACENAKKSLESKVKHLEEQVSFRDKSLVREHTAVDICLL